MKYKIWPKYFLNLYLLISLDLFKILIELVSLHVNQIKWSKVIERVVALSPYMESIDFSEEPCWDPEVHHGWQHGKLAG